MFLAPLAFVACVEDAPVFTISDDEAEVGFLNTFAGEYLLSDDTEANIAERFIWNTPSFGETPVNVSYDLSGSIYNEFDSATTVTSTTETNVAVTVEQLLDFAGELGLDNDPSTTDADGNANNTGIVYFWVTATVGEGDNAQSVRSDSAAISITYVEIVADGSCNPIYIVGAGAVDAGWDWGTPVVLDCAEDVFTAKINLAAGGDNTFRFFTAEGDWGSGLNYPHYEGEGYTIDAQLENAMDGDQNFRLIANPGVYTITVDDVNKTISVAKSELFLVGAATPGGWDWAGPTVMPEVSVGVFQTTFNITNETFRFFTVRDDWGSGLNYPHYSGEGYTIDANFEDAMDGDNNFRYVGAEGEITLTLNTNDLTITIE